MLTVFHVHYKLCKKCIICMFLFFCMFNQCGVSCAKESGLPEDVVIVKNERVMINNIIKGMRRHQSQFVFYYPGISKDFKKYQRQSSAYSTFFEKLSKKDGYRTGIVSGYCVMICGEKKQYISLQLCYLTTRRQEQKINKQVKRIVKQIGRGSDAYKAMKAHDYLIGHMRYDKRYYNPYYAFSKGKGICMSYALAYQRILQEMKIPCIYIKEQNHAWNMVKIGKCWYNVDVTWDDRKVGKYRYFLKADSDFSGHKRPASKWLASLKKASKSYDLNKIQ